MSLGEINNNHHQQNPFDFLRYTCLANLKWEIQSQKFTSLQNAMYYIMSLFLSPYCMLCFIWIFFLPNPVCVLQAVMRRTYLFNFLCWCVGHVGICTVIILLCIIWPLKKHARNIHSVKIQLALSQFKAQQSLYSKTRDELLKLMTTMHLNCILTSMQ